MGGDTKVRANGERVLSCMGEQCPATLVTLNVCKGGGAGFVVALAMSSSSHPSKSSSLSESSPIWDIR